MAAGGADLMGTFAADIRAWCDKAKDDADKIVRYTLKTLDGKIVYASPVGDPAKWKRNPNKRKAFGKFSAVGPKKDWQLGFVSGETSSYSMSGAGYVGGRFRSNWIMSTDVLDTAIIDSVAASAQDVIDAHAAIIETAEAGHIHYLQNNLPYAERLEKGWSKQAPAGMVALAVVQFQGIVDEAVKKIK